MYHSKLYWLRGFLLLISFQDYSQLGLCWANTSVNQALASSFSSLYTIFSWRWHGLALESQEVVLWFPIGACQKQHIAPFPSLIDLITKTIWPKRKGHLPLSLDIPCTRLHLKVEGICIILCVGHISITW